MQIHELKCWAPFFWDIHEGTKTAEFRRNDRDYKVGDILVLRLYYPTIASWSLAGMSEESFEKAFPFANDEEEEWQYGLDDSENPILAQVKHIVAAGFGIPEGFCVLSIQRVEVKVR